METNQNDNHNQQNDGLSKENPVDPSKNNNDHQQNDDMLKEKTNEDHNKQKPNLNNPNQDNEPEVGDDEEDIKKREVKAVDGNHSSDAPDDERKEKKNIS